MFQQMADGHVTSATAAAERAIERLLDASVDLRSVALLDAAGEVLAASSDNGWSERSRELWGAAGATGEEPVQVHVATDAGEVFAVRSAARSSAIAVTQRFALASLMFCDLRAALRELDAEPERADRR